MTCKEIIEMYEEGLQGLRQTLDMAADAAAVGDVEANLRSLPLTWRKEVELYIFYMYDNDRDSSEFFFIGHAEPDPALQRRTIKALRAWIARKRTTAPFLRSE